MPPLEKKEGFILNWWMIELISFPSVFRIILLRAIHPVSVQAPMARAQRARSEENPSAGGRWREGSAENTVWALDPTGKCLRIRGQRVEAQDGNAEHRGQWGRDWGGRGRLMVHRVGTGGQRGGDRRVMLRMRRSLTKEFRLPSTLPVHL